MLDLACYSWCRAFAAVPYLLATVVMKPERGGLNQRFASRSSTSATIFAASPAREFAL